MLDDLEPSLFTGLEGVGVTPHVFGHEFRRIASAAPVGPFPQEVQRLGTKSTALSCGIATLRSH